MAQSAVMSANKGNHAIKLDAMEFAASILSVEIAPVVLTCAQLKIQ